jgi:hypothetical protein
MAAAVVVFRGVLWWLGLLVLVVGAFLKHGLLAGWLLGRRLLDDGTPHWF